jgi:aspartate aminotransferase
MSISQIADSVAPSATLTLNAEANRLRAAGEPIIHLGGGQPVNPAPETALRGAAEKLEDGQIKYGPSGGQPTLKQAIIQYTSEHYGQDVAPENVVVSVGAKQAVFNALYATVDPGDEVVLVAPYWVSYPEMVKMVRGVPVAVTPSASNFVPSMAEIEGVVTGKTKAILINSPNNPSGVMYPAELIEGLVKLCESKGIYLLMDDIYHQLVFDGLQAPSVFEFASKGIDESQVIVINGVSKIYGMTGFRIGWAVGSAPVIKAMTKLQGQMTSCASIVAQAAAEAALNGDQGIVEELRQSIESNRNVMLEELATVEGVQVNKPEGTFYCMPDFSAHNQDSVALSSFLLEKALVVAVPGAPFGMEGYLRMSYTSSPDVLREAVARVKWALEPDAPAEIQMGDRTVVRDW